MRTMLLISVFTAATIRGVEPNPVTMRQKLHAKIVESLPPPPPAQDPTDHADISDEIVELAPLVIIDSPVVRQLAAKIESDSRKLKDGRFSPIKGGTIHKRGGLEIGTWGDHSGLTLLRMRF